MTKFIIILAGLYVLVCILLYFFQEKLIFHPEELDRDYEFSFEEEFEELNIQTKDGTNLNGLLFKTENPQGLIFYLHGNAGALDTWGEIAKTYLEMNYDIFMLDYRGYGKSEGSIYSENQLFDDNQLFYDEMRKRYDESNIIVLGYSIGSGMAAKLASDNQPKHLILQTPYYSLIDLMKIKFPIIPTFILKYQFTTNEYLKQCNMPVTVFHGDQDQVIYYGSSLKLKEEYPDKIELITLEGQIHGGISKNRKYRTKLKNLLNSLFKEKQRVRKPNPLL